MSKAFLEIVAGLENAIAHAQGKTTNVIEHKSDLIRAIREPTGMTQHVGRGEPKCSPNRP